jgi:undecaprenyl-diphosphatase
MTMFQAVALGVVQGVTEFLPVSSSGHLVLLQKCFGMDEPPLFFDTALHGGTLIAVFLALRADVWALLKKPLQKTTLLLIIATLPTVIAALLFKDIVEKAFQSGSMLGPAFLVTALALTLSELLSRRRSTAQSAVQNTAQPPARQFASITVIDALVIGLCQAAALLPAVSRSGLTLSGALSRGIDREAAARFSFLLSIPAILGALVLQLPGAAAIPAEGRLPLIAGTAAAFITGFLAVTLMLALVRKRRLFLFAAYTAALGVFCIIAVR